MHRLWLEVINPRLIDVSCLDPKMVKCLRNEISEDGLNILDPYLCFLAYVHLIDILTSLSKLTHSVRNHFRYPAVEVHCIVDRG